MCVYVYVYVYVCGNEEGKDEDKKEEGERGRGGKEENFFHLNSTAKFYNVELIFNFVIRVL